MSGIKTCGWKGSKNACFDSDIQPLISSYRPDLLLRNAFRPSVHSSDKKCLLLTGGVQTVLAMVAHTVSKIVIMSCMLPLETICKLQLIYTTGIATRPMAENWCDEHILLSVDPLAPCLFLDTIQSARLGFMSHIKFCHIKFEALLKKTRRAMLHQTSGPSDPTSCFCGCQTYALL